MRLHAGAPVSIVLELERARVAAPRMVDALAAWLGEAHGVALDSEVHQDLVVEWRVAAEEPFACQLVVSDSSDQVRRTVTVLSDESGCAAVVEEVPLTTIDAPRAPVDLSDPITLLLRAFMPFMPAVDGLERGRLNHLRADVPERLLTSLQEDLRPGLVVAVTPENSDVMSTAQQQLLTDLMGVSLVASVPVGSAFFADLNLVGVPRPGSAVCISRDADGLDVHIVGSTSLRTRTDSARRLIVRRQLSAPTPFDLERRRSAALARILAINHEIDLPTAMQLLEQESERASLLDNRVKELETQYERALDDHDRSLAQLDDALSQLRYLERAFRDLGQLPAIELGVDDDWRPESAAEALLAAKESLPFLVITAQEEMCEELDAMRKRSIWAKKIWLSLRSLNDYCRVKVDGGFNGNLTMYQANAPAGTIPLLAEYATGESESTTKNPGLRAIRMFSVSRSIDQSGRIFMGEHIKIDQGGRNAPRIHFCDDSGGDTQRIHIGYIGPHLATSSSF